MLSPTSIETQPLSGRESSPMPQARKAALAVQGITKSDTNQSRRARTLGLASAAVLLVALIAGGAGYAVGRATAPEAMDMEKEIANIEKECTWEDLYGMAEDLSGPCATLIAERMALLEKLVHAGGEPTKLNATASENSGNRRQLWWWGDDEETNNCDGEWDSDTQCCRANRPGPATGPSPICRAGIMHGCSDDKDYFHCSWWNGFCWAFCRPYDEVKYCGWCGNPM